MCSLGLCHSEAVCINTIGSFDCACKDGLFGSGKNERNGKLTSRRNNSKSNFIGCVDADECKMDSNKCAFKAICKNTHGSYECTCNEGYTGNGHICEDVNECVELTHECPENSKCFNNDGSYFCECLRIVSYIEKIN